MSGQGEKKRSDSQNRLEGGKPRYSQHESGSSGDQLEEQRSAEIITREDRCTASLGEEMQPLGEARHRGQVIFTSCCPLEKEQKCQWRKTVAESKGKGKDNEEELGLKAEWAAAIPEEDKKEVEKGRQNEKGKAGGNNRTRQKESENHTFV